MRASEEQLGRLREQIEASRKLATKANRQFQTTGRARRGRVSAAASSSAVVEDTTEEEDEDVAATSDSLLDADTQANLAAIRSFSAESAGGSSSLSTPALTAGSAGSTAAAALASKQAFVDPLAALERSVRDESLKQALANVKADLAELIERRRTLDIERAALLLELNRHKNESASKWRTLPYIGRDGSPQYQLLQLMGRGGFSEVWRAMDLVSVREVAVKLHQLHEHWPREKKENFVKHALRESSIQLEMRHPHIVALLDAFPHDDNTFVTVLEYCSGTDLDQVLKQQGCLPERDAKKVLTQVLSALAFLNGFRLEALPPGADPSTMPPPAPRRKVIHYDLKVRSEDAECINVFIYALLMSLRIYKEQMFCDSCHCCYHAMFRPDARSRRIFSLMSCILLRSLISDFQKSLKKAAMAVSTRPWNSHRRVLERIGTCRRNAFVRMLCRASAAKSTCGR
jgi:hypothetical protein